MHKVVLHAGLLLVLVVSLAAGSAAGSGAVTIDAEIGISAAVSLVETRLAGLMKTMQVMAHTEEVRSGDWSAMEGLLAQFEELSIPLLAWFARPDGSYYAVGIGLAAANLGDRPYFPQVMAGEMTVGDLLVSRATGERMIAATVPVEQAGEVVGALGVSVFAAQLSQIVIRDIGLPDGIVLCAVNEAGQVTLHSNPDLIMQDADTLPSPSTAVTKASDMLGWLFVLDLP